MISTILTVLFIITIGIQWVVFIRLLYSIKKAAEPPCERCAAVLPSKIIEQGYRPINKLDTSRPPRGGSAIFIVPCPPKKNIE